jgi:DNA-binding CsgD family transcriptional regulator
LVVAGRRAGRGASVPVDGALAAALSAVSVFQGLDDRTAGFRPLDGLGVAVTALTALPAMARRRAPTRAMAACFAFWFAEIALGHNPVFCTYGVLLVLYTVAETRSRPRTAVCLAVCGGVWIFVGLLAGAASVLSLILQAVVIPVVIWKVADGAKQLTRAYAPPVRPVPSPPDLAALTTREAEVLRLVGTGESNAGIAGTLFVSEATVKTHLNRLMSKLGLSSRAQAVVTAYDTGPVVPGRSRVENAGQQAPR